MRASAMQAAINWTKVETNRLSSEYSAVNEQQRAYIDAYLDQGGKYEDLDDDPYFVALDAQSERIKNDLPMLKGNENSYEDISKYNSPELNSLKSQMDEIIMKRIELQQIAQAYVRACVEAGYAGNLNEDAYMVALQKQDDYLASQESGLRSQMNSFIQQLENGSEQQYNSPELDDINLRLTQVYGQRQEVVQMMANYATACAEAGYAGDLNEDAFYLSMSEKEEYLKAEENSLISQKTNLLQHLNEATLTEKYDSNELNNIQAQLNNIYTQKNELSKQLANYVAAYVEAGGTGDLNKDLYFVSLQKQAEYLEMEESNLNYQKNNLMQKLDEANVVAQYNSPELNNIQTQLNNIYTQKNEISKQLANYVAAYVEAGGTGDLNNDAYFVALQKQAEYLEMEESNLNYQKNNLMQYLDDASVVAQYNSPELNNIQAQLDDIYKQKNELTKQLADYAAMYAEPGAIISGQDDAYQFALRKQVESLEMQENTLRYQKNNLIKQLDAQKQVQNIQVQNQQQNYNVNVEEKENEVSDEVANNLVQLFNSYFKPQNSIVVEEEKSQENNLFDATETTKETPQTVEPQQKDYTTRQVERYEKNIAKYEKQIKDIEASDDANKEAKIASLEQKIEKYKAKIQELVG